MCLATVIYSTKRDKYKNNGMKNLSLSEYIARQIIFLIPQNYNIMCLATVIYSTERDNRKKPGIKNLSLSPYISVLPYGERDKFFIPDISSLSLSEREG